MRARGMSRFRPFADKPHLGMTYYIEGVVSVNAGDVNVLSEQ